MYIFFHSLTSMVNNSQSLLGSERVSIFLGVLLNHRILKAFGMSSCGMLKAKGRKSNLRWIIKRRLLPSPPHLAPPNILSTKGPRKKIAGVNKTQTETLHPSSKSIRGQPLNRRKTMCIIIVNRLC